MNLQQSNYEIIDPSPELLGKVMTAIKYRQELSVLKRKFVFSFFFFALSALLYVPTALSVKSQAQTSGMFGYLSILVFDLKSIGSYWQDLVWSLLESFPALGVAGLLALTLFVGIATMAMVKYIKSIRGLSQLIHN